MLSIYEFTQQVSSLTQNQINTINETIDSFNVGITHQNHGFHLFGEIPTDWDTTEASLHNYMQIAMVSFEHFSASISIDSTSNTLYLSQFLPKPQSQEDILIHIEQLINQLDVWVDLTKPIAQRYR